MKIQNPPRRRDVLSRLILIAFLGPLLFGPPAGGSVSGGIAVRGTVEIVSQALGGKRVQEDASGVVVWLEGGNPANAGMASRKPGVSTLVQRKKTFLPHTLTIPVGEKVRFPNQDDIFHNVFSLSGAQPFDLGLYKSGKVPQLVFNKPGVLRIFCNIHSEMFAFIHVFDQATFSATSSW